jgi:Type VI secretion system effector, Hcp
MAKHQSRRAALSVENLEDRRVAAVDAFIWFESPGVVQVRGETKADAPAFEIKDFSFGVENPTTIGSATGGAGAGKIKFNEFTIKKTSDSASPAFFQDSSTSAPSDEGPEESITFVYGK